VPNVALPIRYSRAPIVDPVAAAAVGQHTSAVLLASAGLANVGQRLGVGNHDGNQALPEEATRSITPDQKQ